MVVKCNVYHIKLLINVHAINMGTTAGYVYPNNYIMVINNIIIIIVKSHEINLKYTDILLYK